MYQQRKVYRKNETVWMECKLDRKAETHHISESGWEEVRDSNLSKTFHLDISKEGLEKKQLEEERERLQKRVQELED